MCDIKCEKCFKEVWKMCDHMWFQAWSHMWFFITSVNHTKITLFHTLNKTSAMCDVHVKNIWKKDETCESHLYFLLSVISCMITLTKMWLQVWITHLFTFKSDLPVAISTITIYYRNYIYCLHIIKGEGHSPTPPTWGPPPPCERGLRHAATNFFWIEPNV